MARTLRSARRLLGLRNVLGQPPVHHQRVPPIRNISDQCTTRGLAAAATSHAPGTYSEHQANNLRGGSTIDGIISADFTANYARRPSPLISTTQASNVNAVLVANGRLYLRDESGSRIPVSGRWLRDVCRCTTCRNQDTSQRKLNVLKMSQACNIVEVQPSVDEVKVTFADGHQSSFATESLLERDSGLTMQNRYGIAPVEHWTASIDSDPPTVQHSGMTSSGDLRDLLQNIRTYGFTFIDNIPATPEASQSLLEAIGPIRNTHYGGFYDFTSDLSSKDTAYTSESLDPHTDNTYFTEPAGLQALHMLSHTEGSGGESSLVDGFGCAAQLLAADPEAYRILSNTGVYAHASGNDGINIQPSHAFPTLSHHPELGHLSQVRWNTADRAGVAVRADRLDEWYDAAAKFDAILSDQRNQYWFQLKPGKMLVFDNWRVLHGRAAFTGKRRMCGGYINRDDYISRYRMTALGAYDVHASTVTG